MTIAVLTMLVATVGVAHADEPPSSAVGRAAAQSRDKTRVQRARAAFAQALSLRKRGLWSDALEAYRVSAALHPNPVTSYNIALCLRALARYTQAQKAFVAALLQRDARGKLLPRNVAKRTRGYLRAIAARLARGRVTLGRSNLAVAIDGRPMETLLRRDGTMVFIAGTRSVGAPEVPAERQFEVLLDPGEHVIVVARGGRSRAITRTFRAGQTLKLQLDLVDPPPPPPRDVRGAITAWATSGVALIVATVAGAVAIHRKQKLDDACPTSTSCPEQVQSDIDTLRTAGNISTAGFAVAATGATLGAVLLFSAPRQTKITEVGGGIALRF